MSVSMYFAVLSLVIIFVILSTIATGVLFVLYTQWATKRQLELVQTMFDDDDDLDQHYEDNRNIIDPLADPRNS